MALSGPVAEAAFAKTLRSLALTIEPGIEIGESVEAGNVIINNCFLQALFA